eukprot:TRINITY_DN1546_c0_g1_i11.p1 TRINITY_DN1546_c0_g1~~TRINITY_DN1546_c0_g1_i11.p1  ORF type:complete len:130 (+),score=26.70 TRINITY_DN1546_c0_g1_i11:747-1136(+)
MWMLEKNVFDMWEEEAYITPFPLPKQVARVSRNEFFSKIKEEGVTSVEVVGVASDYCVMLTIKGFLAQGFSITTYPDLTCGIERDISKVVEDLKTISKYEDCTITLKSLKKASNLWSPILSFTSPRNTD